MAVVVDPTPQNGIERASQLIQGGAGAAMEPPAPNGVTDTLGSFRAHRRTEGDEERTPPIFRLSSPKRVPEKVELRAGVITSSIVILTKDHVGLLGIPYFDGDSDLDVAEYGTRVRELVADLEDDVFDDARLLVEPGRYLVGEAGVYLVRVSRH